MTTRRLSVFAALSLVLLISFLPLISCLLTNPFSTADTSRIVSDLSRQQPFEDAQSIHSHLHTLLLLEQPLPKADKALSATLEEALSSSDVADIHYAVASLALLGQKPAVPAKQLATLSSALGSSNLVALYHAISALLVLHDSAAKLSLADYNVGKAFATLASLEELDYTYRLSPRAEDGNIYYTSLVYRALAAAVKAKAGGSDLQKQAKDALAHSKTALATDRSYGLPVDVSQLHAVGSFVSAVSELSGALSEQVGWAAADVEEVAQYLLAHRHTSDVDEAHAVVAGLHAIAALPDAVQPHVLSAGGDALKATVTNVLGAPLKSGGSFTTTISSAEGESVDSGKWASASPGLYTATHSVGGARVALPLRKTAAIKSLAARITVTDSPKAADVDETAGTVTYPAVLAQPYTADGSKYVYVRVTVDCDVAPSQVVALFTRTTSSEPSLDSNSTGSTPFPARKVGEGAYVARVNVGSLDVMEALGGGGSFIVHVLVGDVLLSEPVDWAVANLELTLPRLSAHSAALDQPVTTIAHTFRPADKTRSYLLPLLFTGALLAVFGALVLRVLAITSIELPPAAESVWALAFQGVLCGLMALYVLYWLRLNIFQALTGSVLLAIAAVLTGNKALTALHIRKSKLHVQ